MRDASDESQWHLLALCCDAADLGELLLGRELGEARFRTWQLAQDLDDGGFAVAARDAWALLLILEAVSSLPAAGAGLAYAYFMDGLHQRPEWP
jgi:hypothetical protein